MSVLQPARSTRRGVAYAYTLLAVTLAALAFWQPAPVWQTLVFVVSAMVHVTPIVIPGILLAAWITASGASDRVAAVFHGRTFQMIAAAAVIGALIPVCGITVLPLMAGLLAAGVPLAPVMAFWLASPITGPAMLSATVATLGWEFAMGKALAAIGLGLFGGSVTSLFAGRQWARIPLRSNSLVNALGPTCGSCDERTSSFDARVWRETARKRRFAKEIWSISRLIVLVLTPAFAAEFLLNAWLQPDALTAYVGNGNAWAVPIAVFIGGPAYIDGYAALPLTRALLEHGMSPGAAMAFLVSGGVVSIWGRWRSSQCSGSGHSFCILPSRPSGRCYRAGCSEPYSDCSRMSASPHPGSSESMQSAVPGVWAGTGISVHPGPGVRGRLLAVLPPAVAQEPESENAV